MPVWPRLAVLTAIALADSPAPSTAQQSRAPQLERGRVEPRTLVCCRPLHTWSNFQVLGLEHVNPGSDLPEIETWSRAFREQKDREAAAALTDGSCEPVISAWQVRAVEGK